MTMPTRIADRYELGEILGLGGMSEVHLGRDLKLNRDVAIKVLRADLSRDPTFYLRFRREAQHAAGLNQPNIVAVHDTGEAETVSGRLPFIVMEYVDGSTLRDAVDRHGPMDPLRAVEVVADVCLALEFSHRDGIVHRDVKPANIMISRSGVVKVMDFGIAKVLADANTPLTQTAAVIGTAHYLSPEQASGEPVDARSDIYSLGCVLYELLTGETPFTGESAVAVAYQHVRREPLAPSRRNESVSGGLDAVVLKALSKNPDNRYQGASEMRNDLLRVHKGATPSAPKVYTDAERTDLTSTRRKREGANGGNPIEWIGVHSGRRRRLVVIAALAVVAAVLGVVFTTVEDRGSVRVPDLHAQPQQDAVAALQNLGFKIRGPVTKPDPSLPAGEVIGTDPAAGSLLAGGDEVTVNVSSGLEQRDVPNCSNLTPDDCARRLSVAGFTRAKQTPGPSATVPEGQVIGTSPAAGQRTAVTTEISIQVSAGPGTRRVPDVTGQTVEAASANLNTAGFPVVLQGPVDSMLPAGRVVATDPPVGSELSVDSAITLKVSSGNQFPMPVLIGRTWDEVQQLLQNLGYAGSLINGGDQPGPSENRGRVVKQNPQPDEGVNRDAAITLIFGS